MSVSIGAGLVFPLIRLPTGPCSENTAGYVTIFNEIVTELPQVRLSDIGEIRKKVTLAEEFSQAIWGEINGLLSSSSLDTHSKRMVQNDLRVRLDIDKRIEEMIKNVHDKSLKSKIKQLKENNKKAIRSEMDHFLLCKKSRKDTKDAAVETLRDLIHSAYGHKKGTFTLLGSLGKYLGIKSSDNQFLQNVLYANYSRFSSKRIRLDAKESIRLIQEGFKKVGLPREVAVKIDKVNEQLHKLQKQSVKVNTGLIGTTPQDRWNELVSATTRVRLKKLTPAQAKQMVLGIIDPKQKNWPSTYSGAQTFGMLCADESQKIQDEDFDKLLLLSGIFAFPQLRHELSALISRVDRESVVHDSLGHVLHGYSSENKRLQRIKVDVNAKTVGREYKISVLKEQADDAVLLIQKAYWQVGREIPGDIKKHLAQVKKLSAQL